MAVLFYVCPSGNEHTVSTQGADVPTCDTGQGQWISEADMLGAVGVDSDQIAYAFGWGFASVVFCWWLGYLIGVALAVIKKA